MGPLDFDDPTLTRDLDAQGQPIEGGLRQADIVTEYRPGTESSVRLVAGPGEEDLRLLIPGDDGGLVQDVRSGSWVDLGAGLQLRVVRYALRSQAERRPLVIPQDQRDRDVGFLASTVRVTCPEGVVRRRGLKDSWLLYHLYAFDGEVDLPRRYRFEPSELVLNDGRRFELLYSRAGWKCPPQWFWTTLKSAVELAGLPVKPAAFGTGPVNCGLSKRMVASLIRTGFT